MSAGNKEKKENPADRGQQQQQQLTALHNVLLIVYIQYKTMYKSEGI